MKTIMTIAAFLLAGTAAAHDHASDSGVQHYDTFCCSGSNGGVPSMTNGDCQPIPATAVKVTAAGYQVTLGPGDHALVTKQHVWTIPFSEARESTDSQYHGCIYPDESILRCFYAPPQSF